MSTSLTLKGIPEPIYRRVKQAAERNHRSMNGEIIACLEQVLGPRQVDLAANLEAARRLRAAFLGPALQIEDLTAGIARERARR
jgi:plasmid stability protein